MTLDKIAQGSAGPVSFAALGGNTALATAVQQRLTEAGLLEPPADGQFGPISHWALGEFMAKIGTPAKAQLDKESARALLAPSVKALFPLTLPPTLAGRLAAAVLAKGWWFSRHPGCINIVYVEGMNPDGSANEDKPNIFNDLRTVLQVDAAGVVQLLGSWQGTTEPGAYYTTQKVLDRHGAARIAFGQYKAWEVGMHPRNGPNPHEALVQVASITVHRDLNQDFERTGDKTFTGLFGVNQHWGFDLPENNIGQASAGCLVGRTKVGHKEFMKLVKQDVRYIARPGFRFTTAVLPAADVPDIPA